MPVEAAQEALTPLPLEGLDDLVITRGGEVSSPYRLTPWHGLLFAHDRAGSAGPDPDHVTSVNAASRTLASLTVRRPVRSALDVGTGSGVQAVLAARHAERVVATDVNSRALRFTALNARLNGFAGSVECREGSLFEPARDERFDLIVSNPPYVVSPDSELVYRDSGWPADEMSRRVVTEAPRFLGDRGFATILCNWIVARDADPFERVTGWVAGSGCDTWIIRYAVEEPVAYARAWNHELRLRDPSRYDETVERWVAYYEREQIESIGVGAVVFRARGDGGTWLRKDVADRAPTGAAGEQILRVFAAEDWLLGHSDDALLDERFVLVEPHRLDQALEYRGGAYTAQDARLVLQDGVGIKPLVEPHAIHALLTLDGARSLREVIHDVIESTGLDEEVVGTQTLGTVRRLYELGFVERRS